MSIQQRYHSEVVALFARLDEIDQGEQETPSIETLVHQTGTKLQTIEMERRELGFDGQAARSDFIDMAANSIKCAHLATHSKRR